MKRKNVHVSTNLHKMPRHNVKNNNSVMLKLLRRIVPFKNQVEPLPTTTEIGAIKRKHFAKKFKSGTTKEECTVKFLLELEKLLHNLKFNKSETTMDILRAKSNMRLTFLHVMGVIITLAPNTVMSNAMAS